MARRANVLEVQVIQVPFLGERGHQTEQEKDKKSQKRDCARFLEPRSHYPRASTSGSRSELRDGGESGGKGGECERTNWQGGIPQQAPSLPVRERNEDGDGDAGECAGGEGDQTRRTEKRVFAGSAIVPGGQPRSSWGHQRRFISGNSGSRRGKQDSEARGSRQIGRAGQKLPPKCPEKQGSNPGVHDVKSRLHPASRFRKRVPTDAPSR